MVGQTHKQLGGLYFRGRGLELKGGMEKQWVAGGAMTAVRVRSQASQRASPGGGAYLTFKNLFKALINNRNGA